jgi:hypothetical protein
MTRKADPHRALTGALAKMFAPLEMAIEDASVSPWASATFRGTRHVFWLNVAGSAAAETLSRVAKDIGEHAFDFKDHIVADILVTQQSGPRCCIEALTVEVN